MRQNFLVAEDFRARQVGLVYEKAVLLVINDGRSRQMGSLLMKLAIGQHGLEEQGDLLFDFVRQETGDV
jgi:hypothetical protein